MKDITGDGDVGGRITHGPVAQFVGDQHQPEQFAPGDAEEWVIMRQHPPLPQRLGRKKVQAFIREQSGKHFDPKVVEAFLPNTSASLRVSHRGQTSRVLETREVLARPVALFAYLLEGDNVIKNNYSDIFATKRSYGVTLLLDLS